MRKLFALLGLLLFTIPAYSADTAPPAEEVVTFNVPGLLGDLVEDIVGEMDGALIRAPRFRSFGGGRAIVRQRVVFRGPRFVPGAAFRSFGARAFVGGGYNVGAAFAPAFAAGCGCDSGPPVLESFRSFAPSYADCGGGVLQAPLFAPSYSYGAFAPAFAPAYGYGGGFAVGRSFGFQRSFVPAFGVGRGFFPGRAFGGFIGRGLFGGGLFAPAFGGFGGGLNINIGNRFSRF